MKVENAIKSVEGDKAIKTANITQGNVEQLRSKCEQLIESWNG